MIEKIKYWSIFLIGVALFSLGYYVGKSKTSTKSVERAEQQVEVTEKVRIVERPNGSKVTTIVTQSKSKSEQSKEVKAVPMSTEWSLGVYRFDTTRYSLDVNRRLLGDLYGGVVLGIDKGEFTYGVGLRYNF
jgi:hypothetical protein